MSNVNFKQVAEDVRNLSRVFNSVRTLGETLDAIGSIEQVERAANDRRAKAIAAAEQAEAAAAKAKTALAAAEQEVADAKAQAKKVVADANTKATTIVSVAEAEAARLVSDAEQREAQEAARVADLRKEADEAVKLTAVKRDEFLAFEQKIEKLKGQAAKLIGG